MNRRRVVLVVEDDPLAAELLQDTLREQPDLGVVAVADGAEALRVLAGGGVDLVLLDLSMPGIDGFELLTRLRADPATRELPVLVSSAQGRAAGERALALGASGVLSKPYDVDRLAGEVRRLIGT